MAYDPSNLSALAYANAFTGWHYRTTDAASDCLQPGYFETARNMLRIGDQMILTCGDYREFVQAFVVSVNPVLVSAVGMTATPPQDAA